MVVFDALGALPDDQPGPWGDSVAIRYDRRDVLLYAVGIGIRDLRFVFEDHPGFAPFPTFPIRWGGVGATVDEARVPPSPGPLNIDAERYLKQLAPMPDAGEVTVRSRLVGVHPKGTGNALVEYETEVSDADGRVLVEMISGSFRRGVKELGDIEPFTGAGVTYSTRLDPPGGDPDVVAAAEIADNQAHLYRLSGDYNPLHIDPDAARFGGFDRPILHGLCTFGHCAQLLLGAVANGDPERFGTIQVRFSSPVYPGDRLEIRGWNTEPGTVVFQASVGDRVVVSNAQFTFLS